MAKRKVKKSKKVIKAKVKEVVLPDMGVKVADKVNLGSNVANVTE